MLRHTERRQKLDLPHNASEAEVDAAEHIAEGQAAAADARRRAAPLAKRAAP